MTNEQYHTLIHPYTDAMNLILTRLEILNHCAADNEDVRPIHGITHRIKKKISMENKLKKKHSNGSVQDARTLLKDIAGIRVICFFERDIYQLAESLKKQVEIQFRTISMDFWAAMEHRICYKSQPFDELEMKSAFRQYAEILDGIEKSFEVYSENCG